jgi:hypothetical protein
MKPEQEKQLLQSLYDRIFQAITYSPDGKENVFDPSTTLVQLSKNEAIDPDDFKNQLTPMNLPPQGDFNAAYNFSAMVDTLPALQPTYAPTTLKVSETYKEIVNGANASNLNVDPAQKEIYDANSEYLNQVTEIPNPKPQPPTMQIGPSPIAQTYDDNQSAYVLAYGGYRTAMNGYDLTKPADQRAWNAIAPGLQLNIDKAWNAWVRQGKANVERAQNALASSINNIVSSVIADSQKAVADDARIQSGANRFLLSYPLPGDWTQSGGKGATDFTLTSATLNTSSDSNFNSYGGGGSFSYGLWSVGGGFQHSDGQTNYHMDANNVEISAKLSFIRIMRPWLNALLFTMQSWYLSGQSMDKVSNGKLAGNVGAMLPLIPTAFVVMSDVTIKADFSAQDQSHIESATSGSASVGWGPFSISGNYSHGESHDRFAATYDAGTIKVPGMQIVAWVNQITPASPPMNDPTGKPSVQAAQEMAIPSK